MMKMSCKLLRTFPVMSSSQDKDVTKTHLLREHTYHKAKTRQSNSSNIHLCARRGLQVTIAVREDGD